MYAKTRLRFAGRSLASLALAALVRLHVGTRRTTLESAHG